MRYTSLIVLLVAVFGCFECVFIHESTAAERISAGGMDYIYRLSVDPSREKRKSIQLSPYIWSAWGKDVDLNVEGNGLRIVGKGKRDADCITIGYLESKDYEKLIIKIKKINGKPYWYDRMIGFCVDEDLKHTWEYCNVTKIPAPILYRSDGKGSLIPINCRVNDKFIDNKLVVGDELHYSLVGKERVFIAVKVYVNEDVEYEFEFFVE